MFGRCVKAVLIAAGTTVGITGIAVDYSYGQGFSRWYVHRKTHRFSRPPYYCYCYGVARRNVVQGWLMLEIHSSRSRAVARRNALSARPNTCSGCGVTGTDRRRWAVFRNCRAGGRRCTIGVARGNYAYPGNQRYREGWRRTGRLYNTGAAAWRYACALHRSGRYYSPDIARGRIRCRGVGTGNSRVFRRPRAANAYLDHCLYWARQCGYPVAHRFCRQRGYRRASTFSRFRPGRTYVVGSRRYCTGRHCTAFRSITCVR